MSRTQDNTNRNGQFTSTSVSGQASVSTRALHGPPRDKKARGNAPLVGGIVQSTTYLQPEIGAKNVHAYSRVSNPTVDETEVVLGSLEDAPPAVTFASGLAAETALFLTLLHAGDHAVVGDAIYGGTVRLFRQVLSELGIAATFVDASDAGAIERAITPRTKLVFIETPANPTLRLTDIRAVAEVTRRRGVPLAVDNTFLTPVLQRPLDLGADIAVYATTKLIEGHSTTCGGAVVSRAAALLEKLRWMRKCTGGIQNPFNAWLTTRGIKTLPLRVKEQARNAAVIAEWLAQNEHVSVVNYPGLASFPQTELARAQHIGGLHGSVISFEVVGGAAAGRSVLETVELCSLVEHVGSVETLITHPVSMTHADVPPEQRRAAGITDGLIRLSVGLEEPADVIEDLERALEAAHAENRGETCRAEVQSAVEAVGGVVQAGGAR